jgi:ArsR family transcriptional regulator
MMATNSKRVTGSGPGGDNSGQEPATVVWLDTGAGFTPPACCTLDISGQEQERLASMFKALGNPSRFEIVKYLVTHPGCITGDIVDFLPQAQATVSQHLKVLREAGWISGEIEGPATCYYLNEENIAWFREKVADIF